MKRAAFGFLLLIIALGISPAIPQGAPADNLSNFAKVNEHLYRGAQPTAAGVSQLKEMGIKTIVSLRGGDIAKEEAGWAANNGIKFVNVQEGNWSRPSVEDVERVVALINDPANQPVFVHCKRGSDRTGTVVAVYRMTQDHWTDDQAIAEAKKFGFGWWQIWMKDFIRDYYRDRVKK
ncbi:MAG: dual specificity protein phosphatase family protein [Acidobacteria bacterium]|nr:dual specificity protein phosphatase family protein [Acidobacteriota bacterium]